MKKIFTSIGIVALGAAAVHGESAASMAMGGDNTKFWSVGASLRGFYDDNYNTGSQKPLTVITPGAPPSTNTAPATARDSLGAEIRPSIAFKFPMDQTTVGLRYIYGATWYEDRQSLDSGNNAWDQSHEFDLLFSHAFSSRYTLDVTDSFVIAQEPELINSVGAVTFPYRTQGNNIRNHGEITLNGGITKRLSFVLGYQNSFYDYENSSGANNFVPATGAVDPSLSGYLDRLEHEGLFNLRFQALPKTVLIGGYNFKQVNYLSDEVVANASNFPGIINDFRTADSRDSRAHILYGGVDQNFTKDLILSFRGGVQLTEYYNAPATEPNDGNTSPWGRISLTYNYLPGSSVQVGFNHSRNQTDVVTPNTATGSLTSDVETSLIYGTINHKFTPRISGKLTAQWQDSEFYGGLYDGLTESFMDVGVNFSYRFNQYFSGEVGYNYSQLTSDAVGRDYDRNRVYLGVSAAY